MILRNGKIKVKLVFDWRHTHIIKQTNNKKQRLIIHIKCLFLEIHGIVQCVIFMCLIQKHNVENV